MTASTSSGRTMPIQWNTDYRWRLKIMDGGMLLLQEKTKDGGFLRVAPHAWARVETPAVDPLAIKASDWCDNFYIPLVDDHAPGFSGSYAHESVYRMKIMDGGMLLFQEKTEDGGFGGFVINRASRLEICEGALRLH